MKKTWQAPRIQVQEFETNEYVAACYSLYCAISGDGKGKFHRTWNSYSATTMRHIKSFCRFFGADVPTKKQWDAMEIESVA